MSNTHADQAAHRLRNGTHNEVARAAVEATLALAYEQRTANLIALAIFIGQHGCKVHEDITSQVDERLGLK